MNSKHPPSQLPTPPSSLARSSSIMGIDECLAELDRIPPRAFYYAKSLDDFERSYDLQPFRVKSKINDSHWAIAATYRTSALSYAMRLLRLEDPSVPITKKTSPYLTVSSAPDLSYLLQDGGEDDDVQCRLLGCLDADGELLPGRWAYADEVYGELVTVRITPQIRRFPKA